MLFLKQDPVKYSKESDRYSIIYNPLCGRGTRPVIGQKGLCYVHFKKVEAITIKVGDNGKHYPEIPAKNEILVNGHRADEWPFKDHTHENVNNIITGKFKYKKKTSKSLSRWK